MLQILLDGTRFELFCQIVDLFNSYDSNGDGKSFSTLFHQKTKPNERVYSNCFFRGVLETKKESNIGQYTHMICSDNNLGCCHSPPPKAAGCNNLTFAYARYRTHSGVQNFMNKSRNTFHLLTVPHTHHTAVQNSCDARHKPQMKALRKQNNTAQMRFKHTQTVFQFPHCVVCGFCCVFIGVCVWLWVGGFANRIGCMLVISGLGRCCCCVRRSWRVASSL